MQRLAGLLPGLFQAPGEFQLIEHRFNRPAFSIGFDDLFRGQLGIGTQRCLSTKLSDLIMQLCPAFVP